MPQLKPIEQRFLVESLAVFTAVPDVIEAFEKEFQKRLDRRQVHEYNCERPHNREVRSKDLVALFDATRKAHLTEVANTRIAHSGWRLRELEELYLGEKGKGLRKSAKATLEQAAKESGGAYTNRHELTGKDGQPLPVAPPTTVVFDLKKLSEAQLDALESIHGRTQPGEHSEGEGPT